MQIASYDVRARREVPAFARWSPHASEQSRDCRARRYAWNESLAPRVTVIVVFKCAPSASVSGIVGSSIGSGTKPRARRKRPGAGDHRDDAIVGAGDNFSIVADDEIAIPASLARASSSSAMSGSPPGLALVATRTKSSRIAPGASCRTTSRRVSSR